MIYHGPDFFQLLLAISTCNNDLGTGPKSHPQHHNCQIKNSTKRTGTQSDFTNSAQKCSISKVDKVLCNTAKDDGVGHIPNPAVCYGGFGHKATKINFEANV